MSPFSYPESAHVRKHGPDGYAHYENYRPWLRDEFRFRCVYCLEREQWVNNIGHFHGQIFVDLEFHRRDYAGSATILSRASSAAYAMAACTASGVRDG